MGETTALVPTGHAIVIHHGADLEGYQVGDVWYIAMRRVCRSLGLDWSSQRQRIMRDSILSAGAAMITTATAGGAQEALGLRLDLFWGWLFKLESERLDPELRPWIEAIQREGYQVLHDHFTDRLGGAPAPTVHGAPDATLDAVAAQLRDINATLTQLRAQHAHALTGEPRPLHPDAAAILRIVRASAVAVSPAHVARLLATEGIDRDPRYVRVRLSRLVARGQLIHAGHGLYAAVGTIEA